MYLGIFNPSERLKADFLTLREQQGQDTHYLGAHSLASEQDGAINHDPATLLPAAQ